MTASDGSPAIAPAIPSILASLVAAFVGDMVQYGTLCMGVCIPPAKHWPEWKKTRPTGRIVKPIVLKKLDCLREEEVIVLTGPSMGQRSYGMRKLLPHARTLLPFGFHRTVLPDVPDRYSRYKRLLSARRAAHDVVPLDDRCYALPFISVFQPRLHANDLP